MLYEIKFFVHDFKTWFARIPMKHSFEDKVLPMMHMRQVLSVVQKEGGALARASPGWGSGRRPVTAPHHLRKEVYEWRRKCILFQNILL